ncbi:MAG: Mu-like prophage major head subunit gpT family protein [Acidovorax sp.]|uniref:phage major capsid protein n=1 Tax=Acidovorax sp. TaxID=1872122 RepID=UPI00391BEE88
MTAHAKRAVDESPFCMACGEAEVAQEDALGCWRYFHANHGNLAAAGGALSIDTLGTARAAMRKQKCLAGEFIDPQPRYLIVPVAMETKAEQLLNSTVDPAKANNTDNLEWVRRLTLVCDPRLDADRETSWYLSADPKQIEGIVRVYLEGEARPFIAQQEGWTRDTMEYKGQLDLGAGVIDWRGLYKNPSSKHHNARPWALLGEWPE